MEEQFFMNKKGNCKLFITGNRIRLELLDGSIIYDDRPLGKIPKETIETLENDFSVELKSRANVF